MSSKRRETRKRKGETEGGGEAKPFHLRSAGGPPAINDDHWKFVAVVLAKTEDVWHEAFRKMGRTYQPPKLVLFSRAVESACGVAGSAVGPVYCPPDHRVDLDLNFFEDLRTRFGVTGDFAQAYDTLNFDRL